MNSKIDWYREVLALEPGSRVFFPLAVLLRQAGRAEEAVAVLRGGLSFHPDHLEARFLLAELLSEAGDTTLVAELDATLDQLIGVLRRYPSFWRLWAAKAGAESRDGAVALRLLASYLSGGGLDILGLLEGAPARPAQPPRPQAEPEAMPAAAPAAEEAEPALPESPPPLRGADEVRQALGDILPPQTAPPKPATGAETGLYPDVRTRTMAGVLAAQGDVKGALDIYRELLAAAPAGEKADLEQRIQELSRLQPAPAAQAAPGSAQSQAPDKNKLIGVLEMLAGRLEARTGM